MSDDRALSPNRWAPLIDRLSQLPAVSRYGTGEAEALVHALSDLEDAYRTYLNRELPQLLREDLSDAELLDALREIGEGIAHIAYHLYEPEFFDLYVARGREGAQEVRAERDNGL